MITADFLTAVQDIIGDPAGDRATLIKRIANREQKELARKYKCTFMLTTGTITTGATVATVNRARSSDVVTLTTAAHGLVAGDRIVVDGMTDSTYDGTYTVVTAASTTTLTYACEGDNETTTADTAGTVYKLVQDYNLPEDYYKPYLMHERTNDEILGHTSIKEIETLYPDPSSISEDVPTDYAIVGMSWVQNQPISSSVLALSSTTSADSGTAATIYGTSGGLLKSEVVSFATSGSSATATSTNAYTDLKYIALGTAPTGTVTVTANSAAVTVLSLLPGKKYKELSRIRLYPTPDAPYTLYYRYYRLPLDLSNNSDMIMIPDAYVDWLIEQTAAKILELDGQKNANTHFGLADTVLTQMIQDEVITEDEEQYSWLYKYPHPRIF